MCFAAELQGNKKIGVITLVVNGESKPVSSYHNPTGNRTETHIHVIILNLHSFWTTPVTLIDWRKVESHTNFSHITKATHSKTCGHTERHVTYKALLARSRSATVAESHPPPTQRQVYPLTCLSPPSVTGTVLDQTVSRHRPTASPLSHTGCPTAHTRSSTQDRSWPTGRTHGGRLGSGRSGGAKVEEMEDRAPAWPGRHAELHSQKPTAAGAQSRSGFVFPAFFGRPALRLWTTFPRRHCGGAALGCLRVLQLRSPSSLEFRSRFVCGAFARFASGRLFPR